MGKKGIKILTALASVGTLTIFVLLAYFLERSNKQVINKTQVHYDTSIINELSVLESDNSFTYSFINDDITYSLVLESHSSVVNLGSYISHDYIYNVSGSAINDIAISWNTDLTYIKLDSVSLSLIDIGTQEITVIDPSSYQLFTSDNGFVTSIKSSEDLYLYSLDIIYIK